MLANHYFLNRNFISEKSIYENILEKDFTNKSIKKKLTVCYITTGEIDNAINLFLAQIKDDIEFVITTDIHSEDCPCREIISQIENEEKLFKNEIDKTTALGMLWLYCSLEKSIKYFNELLILSPKDKIYTEILSILINKLSSNKTGTVN